MSVMGAVWLRLRAELRQQWRAVLALAVLLGLIAGIALTAAAGARRTDTAYPRFLRQSHAADLLVTPARSGFHGYFRALARLPAVASGGRGGLPADVPACPGRLALLRHGGRGEPVWR
jgi:putative ABC transport system permease protein